MNIHRCRYFLDLCVDRCALEIPYVDVRKGMRVPCVTIGGLADPSLSCPERSLPTQEEIDAYHASLPILAESLQRRARPARFLRAQLMDDGAVWVSVDHRDTISFVTQGLPNGDRGQMYSINDDGRVLKYNGRS